MIVQNDSQECRLPDFLIGGASRSGTSSLYFHLRSHPGIFMPELKEPHFFNYYGRGDSPLPQAPPWTLEAYSSHFAPAALEQVCGEASASYLYFYKSVIANVKKLYGGQARNLKWVFSLRNPIERAWSMYGLMKRSGRKEGFFELARRFEAEDESEFPKWGNFIRSGKYAKQVENFRKAFPQVKVFLFEEVTGKTELVVESIFSFVGVDSTYRPKNLNTVFNASGVAKNRFIRPVYRFLFRRNRFKDVFKGLLPYEMRQTAKTAIGNFLMKKEGIPQDVLQYLKDTFGSEIEELSKLVENEEQKRIIRNWL